VTGQDGLPEPVIDTVSTRAAHDGDAELVIGLRHGNRARSEVTLDRHAAAALLESCDAADPEALIGQSWRKVRDALQHAWNRYQPGATIEP
jgi:hypothetical protein